MDVYSKTPRQTPTLSLFRHDGVNVELKVSYPVDRSRSNSKYLLELYLFSPATLQVNSSTYTTDMFFLDLSDYLRFKTPCLTIPELLDNGNKNSPIDRINNMLNSDSLSRDEQNMIVYELKMLGCIVKAYLRDCIRHYEEIVDIVEARDLIKEIHDLTLAKLDLEKRLSSYKLYNETIEALSFVNCYISYLSCVACMNLLKVPSVQSNLTIKEGLIKKVEKEEEYRRKHNSPLIIRKDVVDEQFAYWKAIHKKFVQSVLYLEKDPEEKGKRNAILLLHSLAAGIAMFISVILGLYASSNFKQNSPFFVLVLVCAYIFKDRLKEFLKASSMSVAKNLFPDRYCNLVDSYKGKAIGFFVDDFEHVSSAEIPNTVLRLRNTNRSNLIEKNGVFENKIYYRKFICFNNKVIGKIHTRHNDISSVTRINLEKFMRYMEDSKQTELTINDLGVVKNTGINRTYHLNAIVRVKEVQSGATTKFQKFRIILNKDGIREVENC